MKQILFSTDSNWTGLILRLVLGFIMLPHGAQKLFGAFGGSGFSATMNYFTQTMKIPFAISLLIIFVEFFGSLALIAGLSSKLWAILFINIMTGAITTTCYPNGFFMNWFGNQQGEGYEYHLLIIGICIALIVTGSGAFSVDRLLMK
ncbi:MAG: DoxX family protein [Bacteroidota bacterium]